MFMFLLFIVIEMYVNAASFSVSCKNISFCDCKVVCKGLLVHVLRAWRIRQHVTEVKSLEILSAQHSRVFCPEWPHLSRTKKIQICKERPLLCERPAEKSVMWFWRWKAGWKELASVALKQAWWVLTWFSSQLTAWFVWFSKIFQIPSVRFTALWSDTSVFIQINAAP